MGKRFIRVLGYLVLTIWLAPGAHHITPMGELTRLDASFKAFKTEGDTLVTLTVDSRPKDGYGTVTYTTSDGKRQTVECMSSFIPYITGDNTCKSLEEMQIKGGRA